MGSLVAGHRPPINQVTCCHFDDFVKAMADETRQRILGLLQGDEMSVGKRSCFVSTPPWLKRTSREASHDGEHQRRRRCARRKHRAARRERVAVPTLGPVVLDAIHYAIGVWLSETPATSEKVLKALRTESR